MAEKYKMLETAEGSLNGVNVVTFTKGEVYELPDNLARSFSARGLCVQCDAEGEPVEEVPSKQPEGSGPEETKPDGPQETKPAAPEEKKELPEVEFKPTSEGSSYYHFFHDGQIIEDADGEAIQVQGKEAAREMQEAIAEAIAAEGL